MEDELDDFINYDTVFINSPGSCIELSSKIVNLTSLGISIPRREAQDLLRSRICLRRILTRMENHWKSLLQEIQSHDAKVIFLELQNLVQTARHAVESLPPCWDEGVRVPDASDDRATQSDSACAFDNIPTTEEREGTTSESCEAVTTMDQSGSNVATTRCTTQVYPAPNPPTRELDNDERSTSRRIAETFESIRRDMATAWNKAMIHIDDEMVFDQLNAMIDTFLNFKDLPSL